MTDYELHPVTGDYADFTDAELDGLRRSLRAQGLIVSIMTWRGAIVDGRHRERLCREMNIKRHYDDISDICETEEEMRKIVAGLNQHRRTRTAPLSNKEKQMRAEEELQRDPNRSNRAIARAAGVDKDVVRRARKRSNGAERQPDISVSRRSQPTSATEDKRRRVEAAIRANPARPSREIAREVDVSPDTVERTKRAIKAGTFSLKDGRQIVMPNGAILSELTAKGLALEEDGMSPAEAARSVALSLQAYGAARDILQLANNARLSGADAAKAKAAVVKMDETCRPSLAYEDVRDLILKMWGGQLHSPHNATRRERVVEDYMHAIVVFAEGAERVGAMVVPFLGEDERARARAELQRAKMAVDDAIKHLRGGV